MLRLDQPEEPDQTHEGGEYCELDLILSAGDSNDPPLTEEFVRGVVQQYSDYDDVSQCDQLWITERGPKGKSIKAKLKFPSSLTAQIVKENLDKRTLEGTSISVRAVLHHEAENEVQTKCLVDVALAERGIGAE